MSHKMHIVYTPNGHEIEVTPDTYRKVVKSGKRGYSLSPLYPRFYKNKPEKVENAVDTNEGDV